MWFYLLMSSETTTATPKQTREAMTTLSRRRYTQIRSILVQLPERGAARASTVSKMLNGRKHRALLLYMLLLTCWPWLEGRINPLEGSIWIRALTAKGGLTWTPSTLSRTWAELAELGPRRKGGSGDRGRAVRTVTQTMTSPEDAEIGTTLTSPSLTSSGLMTCSPSSPFPRS